VARHQSYPSHPSPIIAILAQPGRANQQKPVQPLFKKYSDFQKSQITLHIQPSGPSERGVGHRHQTLGSDAVDAAALLTKGAKADGEVVWF